MNLDRQEDRHGTDDAFADRLDDGFEMLEDATSDGTDPESTWLEPELDVEDDGWQRLRTIW
jgi:hypothetical protein